MATRKHTPTEPKPTKVTLPKFYGEGEARVAVPPHYITFYPDGG
jgi:hypothetical protein